MGRQGADVLSRRGVRKRGASPWETAVGTDCRLSCLRLAGGYCSGPGPVLVLKGRLPRVVFGAQ